MKNKFSRYGAALVAAGIFCGCEGLQIERAIKGNAADWLMFGGSPSRINQTGSSLKPPLKLLWQYDAGAGITATPLVRDNILLVATLKGELHAVNIVTGKRIGYLTLDGAVTGTPVWNGTDVCIPISTENETAESISLVNGAKNWMTKLGPSESSLLKYERSLYVTTLNGVLYCLNASGGNDLWKFETAPEELREPIRSSPATDGDVVVFGCDDGCIYAVKRADGTRRWKFQTGRSVFASPIITQGRVIVGSLDGNIYCLDASNGSLRWKFDAHARIFGSASSNGNCVFFGTADGYCYALDIADGKVVWKFGAKSVINSAPLVTGDFLYVGCLDKNLYALNIATGAQVWQYETDGRIRVSPVEWNGMLFVTSEDSYVTAFKEAE
ncbi:MAG TPA: PQQ-binding-like beta-propeller repeat protein [Bacteroidota bacterium]